MKIRSYSTKKVLIFFVHPALEKSRVNRALIAEAAKMEAVHVHDLYEAYPSFNIDVRREQELMEKYDRIIWQHPLYWYSSPALMKEWFDVVLEYGWAYGKGGTALAGKSVTSIITTGGSKEAYCPKGYNCYGVEEFLRPLEQTANLCGMTYEKPVVFYGALQFEGEAVAAAKERYRQVLEGVDQTGEGS